MQEGTGFLCSPLSSAEVAAYRALCHKNDFVKRRDRDSRLPINGRVLIRELLYKRGISARRDYTPRIQ